MNTETYSLLQLGMIEGIGDAYATQLLNHFLNARAIFGASFKELSTLVGTTKARNILSCSENDASIENELDFMLRNEIIPISILDERYPQKLRSIPDAPYLIFFKGNEAALNSQRQLAIVGSRMLTAYGKEWTQYIVDALKPYNVTIVSGMAYGIDSVAHNQALKSNMSTIGVLAHGLDRIYPNVHERMASEMIAKGGLITEFKSQTIPERQHFPMRNRIVAGMTDATIVVETDVKGGAMITAKLAVGYNRDVMAIPGRVQDARSSGCNYLIKTQMAHLVTELEDVLQLMNWNDEDITSSRSIQQRLFTHCNEKEHKIIDLIGYKNTMHIDELQLKSGIDDSQLANLLLQLEFQDIVTVLPGKRYKLNCA
ncbi:DNA-processing protein DprA [Edaphocola aurantiacus]|uniref:DNA-processing protein DprA n=1 Tax=Edaphocola aurantiacus TaxID=2601682 RepID=UPI001C93DE49|nr:DNA-processing protein DprA [Edaphocola aurantiacus]